MENKELNKAPLGRKPSLTKDNDDLLNFELDTGEDGGLAKERPKSPLPKTEPTQSPPNSTTANLPPTTSTPTKSTLKKAMKKGKSSEKLVEKNTEKKTPPKRRNSKSVHFKIEEGDGAKEAEEEAKPETSLFLNSENLEKTEQKCNDLVVALKLNAVDMATPLVEELTESIFRSIDLCKVCRNFTSPEDIGK